MNRDALSCIKLINNSFEYFKKSYGVNQYFYSQNNLKNCSILFFSFVLGNNYLHKLAIKLFNYRCKIDKDQASFVFTRNQQIINSEVTKISNISTFSFFVQKKDSFNYFSRWLIFVVAITDPNSFIILKYFSRRPFYNKHLPIVAGLIGLSSTFDIILANLNTIILFNDHSPVTTLLFLKAKNKEVSTVYIQHAPVSEKFPPLRFDYNILFSPDSVRKYKKQSGSINVYSTCDLRFFSKRKGILKVNRNSILICTNKLDNIDKVKDLCRDLAKINFQVVVRNHPSDKRKWFSEKGIQYSNNTTIWEDLSNSFFVITNESAVPLEAIYNGNHVYKAAFLSDITLDNYGFLEFGLLKVEHHNTKTIIESIQSRKVEFDIQRLPYFIGDINEGRLKIKNLLNQIIENKNVKAC